MAHSGQEYYTQPELWGPSRTSPLESERVRDTVAMVPQDVTCILDVGCGDGLVTNELAQLPCQVVGLDLSLEALRHVEASVVNGSCDRLPFRSRGFDLVLAAELLEHLAEPAYIATVDELQRVSRKYILISVPFDEFLPTRYTKCGKCGTVFHAYHHLRSFSTQALKDLYARFRLKEMVYSGDMVKPDNSLLLAIRQSVGARWFWYERARPWCPMCGNTEFPRPGNSLVSRACTLLNRILPKRKKPHWIIGLFEVD